MNHENPRNLAKPVAAALEETGQQVADMDTVAAEKDVQSTAVAAVSSEEAPAPPAAMPALVLEQQEATRLVQLRRRSLADSLITITLGDIISGAGDKDLQIMTDLRRKTATVSQDITKVVIKVAAKSGIAVRGAAFEADFDLAARKATI